MPVVCGTASGAFLAECPPRQACDALATVAVETLHSSSLLLVRLQAEVDGAASNGTVQVLTCGCSRTWQVVGPTCSMPTWRAWASLCVCVLLVSYCLWLGLRLLQQLLTSAPSLLQALFSPLSSPRALGYALSNEGGLVSRSHSGSEEGHQLSEGSGEHMSTTQHLAQMAVQHGLASTRGVPIMPGQAPMVSLRATSKWPAGFMLLLTIQGIVCLLLFGLLPLVPLAWFGLMLLVLEAVNVTVAVWETFALLRIMQDVLIIARRMRFVRRQIHVPIMLAITLVNILATLAHRVWGVPHILSELLVLVCSVGPLFVLHRFTFNCNFSSPPLRHPSNAVHPSEEERGEQDGRPGLMRQESASDFWRRRLFFMARDRLAHILPPLAVVLAASVFVTLLYMGMLKPDMLLPIQVPMTVLAWARLVVAVQIIKIRSIVRAPKAAAAAANARLQAVQRQLSRRRKGRRQPWCVRLWRCVAGLVGYVQTYLVWMLDPVDDYNSATSAAMPRQGSSMRGMQVALARTLQLPFNMGSSHASSSEANETSGREASEGGGSTGPTTMSTSGRLQQLMSTSGRLRQMLGSSGRMASEGAAEADAEAGQAAVDEEAAAAHYVFTTIMSRNDNNNLSAIFESRNSESSSRPSSLSSENDPGDSGNGIMGGLVNELQRID